MPIAKLKSRKAGHPPPPRERWKGAGRRLQAPGWGQVGPGRALPETSGFGSLYSVFLPMPLRRCSSLAGASGASVTSGNGVDLMALWRVTLEP